MIIIEQERTQEVLDAELPHTAYCKKHGLFTDTKENRISGYRLNGLINRRAINGRLETTSDFMVLLICPYCKANGLLNICKQRL